MATESATRPWSDLAIHPGEFVEEEMLALGMTQQELALRTGRPSQVINAIIRGTKAISENTAIELERALGVPAHLWVNLEANCQLTKARQREQADLLANADLLGDFPLDEMERLGWVATTDSPAERARALLCFLGVASFDAYSRIVAREGSPLAGADGAVQAWVRKGVVDGHGVATGPYNASAFRAAVTAIQAARGFDLADAGALCAAAGVALVLTPHLPGSEATVSARWLTPDKGLIQLLGPDAPASVVRARFDTAAAFLLEASRRAKLVA